MLAQNNKVQIEISRITRSHCVFTNVLNVLLVKLTKINKVNYQNFLVVSGHV